MERYTHRGRTLQRHVKICRDGARRAVRAGLLHQMHRRGPVAVAIQKRAADAAVEDAVEGLMMRLGTPLANELVAFGEAANAKTFRVGRPASEALIVRCVSFLNALH